MLHSKAPPYRQRPLLFLTNCSSLWPVCCKLSYTHKGSGSLWTRHLFTTCSYVRVLYLTCQLVSWCSYWRGCTPQHINYVLFLYSEIPSGVFRHQYDSMCIAHIQHVHCLIYIRLHASSLILVCALCMGDLFQASTHRSCQLNA